MASRLTPEFWPKQLSWHSCLNWDGKTCARNRFRGGSQGLWFWTRQKYWKLHWKFHGFSCMYKSGVRNRAGLQMNSENHWDIDIIQSLQSGWDHQVNPTNKAHDPQGPTRTRGEEKEESSKRVGGRQEVKPRRWLGKYGVLKVTWRQWRNCLSIHVALI